MVDLADQSGDPRAKTLTCSNCGAVYPARQDVGFEEFSAQMVVFLAHVKTHVDEALLARAEHAASRRN